MTGKTKYYIIAAAALLAAVVVVILLIGALKDSGNAPVQETPQPTQSAQPTLPPETEPPEETPEPTQPVEVKKHTVTITAGEGGAAYPCGVIEIEDGEDISILIQADEGYEIAKVTFNDKNVRLLDSFSFTYDVPNVTRSHVFDVQFQVLSTPEPTIELPVVQLTPEPTPEPTRPVSNSDI